MAHQDRTETEQDDHGQAYERLNLGHSEASLGSEEHCYSITRSGEQGKGLRICVSNSYHDSSFEWGAREEACGC